MINVNPNLAHSKYEQNFIIKNLKKLNQNIKNYNYQCES
jgi:hypothetical protein